MKNQRIVLTRIFAHIAHNIRNAVERERYWLFGYAFTSSLVFFLLSLSTPPVIWDSEGYINLADDLIAKGMNFITYDFNLRTFVNPLYLALLIQLAKKLPLTTQVVIHMANIFLYHFGVVLVWNRLRALDLFV